MSVRRSPLILAVMFGLFGVGVLLAVWSLARPIPPALDSTVLRFDVPAELEESAAPFQPLSLTGLRLPRMTVWDVVRGLRHAALDPNVRALVLHIGPVEWGWSKIEDVRAAVLAFRAAGKPVYASVEGGGEREYLLASAANSVCLPPTATLQLDGLAATALFYRGAFDKFGVSPNFAHVGRYKSGVESYTHTAMSAPSREVLEAVLEERFTLLADTLGRAREMAPDSIRGLLDRGPYDAPEAKALGLVDTLLHAADVDSLATRSGALRRVTLSFNRYVDRLEEPRSASRIALVVMSGTIASGRSRLSPTEGRIVGSATLKEALRQARERKGVRAIVLRVDSPGGEADASDEIWREVRRCRDTKPLIVSMSDVAASGGYFVAVAGDSILAQPESLTGSIGVYGGKFNVLGLLRKLGLNAETVSHGRHARMLSPYEDFTTEEAALYQRHLDRFYEVFLSRVAEGRRMTTGEVDSMAAGRVWTGREAARRGLVDRLGGIQEAMLAARARAGIGPDQAVVVETFPRPQASLISRILGDLLGEDADFTGATVPFPPVLRAWMAASSFPSGAVLALMPWTIEIR